MNMPKYIVLITALSLGIGLAASAQDGGLYQDVADPNASFVRVIATSETVAIVQNV